MKVKRKYTRMPKCECCGHTLMMHSPMINDNGEVHDTACWTSKCYKGAGESKCTQFVQEDTLTRLVREAVK